ncbi:MAG: hypothetical protein ACKESB_01520 [Candidatus Hodgkinia cicadicola]
MTVLRWLRRKLDAGSTSPSLSLPLFPLRSPQKGLVDMQLYQLVVNLIC